MEWEWWGAVCNRRHTELWLLSSGESAFRWVLESGVQAYLIRWVSWRQSGLREQGTSSILDTTPELNLKPLTNDQGQECYNRQMQTWTAAWLRKTSRLFWQSNWQDKAKSATSDESLGKTFLRRANWKSRHRKASRNKKRVERTNLWQKCDAKYLEVICEKSVMQSSLK